MAPSITRRAIPTQARSAATVERILSAATNVLGARGLQGLNTNAVAEEAGINVATLYHYFPDKVAILAELFRRDLARRHDFLIQQLEEFPRLENTTAWGAELLNSLLSFRRTVPGTSALRRACRTIPQLLSIEEEAHDRIVEIFARTLRKRYRNLSPNRARNCARVIMEMGVSLLDRASLDFEHSAGLVKETNLLLSSYLGALELGR